MNMLRLCILGMSAILMVVGLVSCEEELTEREKMESVITTRVAPKKVTNIKVVDTVYLIDLEDRLIDLDASRAILDERSKVIKSQLMACKKLIANAEHELATASHPALAFGWKDILREEKENLVELERRRVEHESELEEDGRQRVFIDRAKAVMEDDICYMVYEADVDGSTEQFFISPRLTIVER